MYRFAADEGFGGTPVRTEQSDIVQICEIFGLKGTGPLLDSSRSVRTQLGDCDEVGGCNEAGGETAEAFRSRGFGPRVTAAWALAIRATGRVPLYSTAWTNHASLSVARKLGLVAYASTWSLSD